MAVTNKQVTLDAGVLKPARLADIELDHLERMVQYVARQDEADDLSRFDHVYWEKRLRALAQTHDLVATQRQRVISLLDRLEREALFRTRPRTAA